MQDSDPNKDLFLAINFSEHPGIEEDYTQKIEPAVLQGADINGYSEDGETPLTSAIGGGMGSPKAVKELLRLGADPNKKDRNGWSPWTSCLMRLDDNVVRDRMHEIRAVLMQHEVDQSDGVLIELQQQTLNGNRDRVEELLQKGIDINAPIINPLVCAVSVGDQNMVELLLEHGADPDGSEQETGLMVAARQGHFDLAKRLVAAGADVEKYAWEDPKWTAEQIAEESGHDDMAAWLQQVRQQAGVGEVAKPESSDEKFSQLQQKKTDGGDYGLSTEDIILKLTQWDKAYGIEIDDVAHDRLMVRFKSLPDDVMKLAQEIYAFCPDVVDQGFGCWDDMVEMMHEAGQKPDAEMQLLLEGIDFSDDDFGVELLRKSLVLNQSVNLWWD